METTLKIEQSAPLSPFRAALCRELAALNPAAFANRPKAEAVAAIRAAIAQRPGNSTPAARQAAARKAGTARNLLAKLEGAPYFYADLFAAALVAHGLDTRGAVVELLRQYNRTAYERDRCEALKATTASRRRKRAALFSSAAENAEAAGLVKRAYRLKAQSMAQVAAAAAEPQADATDEENARAAAGYARLKAAGAFD